MSALRELVWLIGLLGLVAPASAAAQDAAKGLDDRDVSARLAAVDALARDADPRAERALHKALRDEDWEVVERAAAGLAEHGTAASLDPLLPLALDGPIERIRRAAARTLGAIAPKPSAERLMKKLSGDGARRACEALAFLFEVPGAQGAGVDVKPLEKVFKAKDRATAAAAARALVAGAGKERARALAKVLDSGSVASGCAALAACEGDLSPDLDEVLHELLARPELSDLLERRALAILGASIRARAADAKQFAAASKEIERLTAAKDGRASARGVRLIGEIAVPPGVKAAADEGTQPAAKPAAPTADAAALLPLLRPALSHSDEIARAAAVRVLARVGGDDAAKIAREIGAGDKSARVRFAALDALADLRGAEPDGVEFLAARLAVEADAEVRAQAAVRLGRGGSAAAVEPLVRATEDRAWEVAACAAVSLGKTQLLAAVDPLAKLVREHKDWKMRGAALAGCVHLYQKSVLPAVIEALADADPCVARTAHAYLSAIAREKLPAKVEPWREWWQGNGAGLLLVDPAAMAEIKKRFGDYQTAPAQVFRDLDLVVLESRGDQIQKVFEKQGVAFARTMAGKVGEDGIHPDSLFVANCTGEIEDVDVERLRWFVLSGGRLFGSCWALTETIVKVVPGVLEKHETRDEVDDEVLAEDVSRGSPYAEGVFASGVQPIYALQGAHLIEVLEPGRAQVLIDSPLCAERWGGGNLAAWFRAGHGVVLDSVNHFNAQGLELAQGLKTRKERQAYAVDHMGLTYADLRAGQDEKYWDNSLRASEQVLDLSVFRLVTNFVRLWRLEVGR